MIASKEEEEIPSLEIYAMAQRVKRLSAMQETRVRSLGWEDPPWRRKWQPTPVLLPGKSHGWRSLVGYIPWGPKGLDTTERLHFRTHIWFQLFHSGTFLGSQTFFKTCF